MNRIVIDKNSNIKVDKDTNYLIDNKVNKLKIDINNCNVNILSIKENTNDEEYEFNINKEFFIFNNICFDSKNLNININLNKEKSEVKVINSVITNTYKKVKIMVNHNYKNTISNVYNNGVTKKDGSINFDVVSKVPKGITGCLVNQDSKIISLNKSNNNEINPILLIDEYDTSARHAAFIGKYNEDKMFYLQSRGLTKEKAEKLLLDGMLVGTLDICYEEKESLKKKI